jgi:hypothetical protein
MQRTIAGTLAFAILLLVAACQPAPPAPEGDATPPGPDAMEGDY